jgi:tetratricopeptide (TPR) repeat protein
MTPLPRRPDIQISSAPPEIRQAAADMFNQGIRAAQANPTIAYSMLVSATEIDPSFFQAWFQVGCSLAELNLLQAAIAAFRRALEIDPLSGKTLVNLGWRLLTAGETKEARKVLERAIEIDPTLAYAYTNLAMVENVEGNLKKAVSLARRGYAIDGDPAIETALALCLMMAGQYAEGLKHFEARFAYKLPQFTQYPMPQWHGDDLKGKTIFIQAEQGLGDTLSFIRFVPPVAMRARAVVMVIHPELLRLFRDMLAPWDNITLIPMPSPIPTADFWTTTTSLPVALGLTNQEIIDAAGLPVPNYRAPAPWKTWGKKLHVGIVWAGAPSQDHDRWRSMAVTNFLELCRVPGVALYSLQVGERVPELHSTGCAAMFKDLSAYMRDVTDTVALLNELDMVITVESAMGHICGAVGKEAWVLVAKNAGDYRCGRAGTRSIWYPGHVIFRQGTDASWRLVLDRVVEALWKRVNGDGANIRGCAEVSKL